MAKTKNAVDSRPMHIGLVADEFPPGPHGGVGTFSHDLATGLVGLGHRVTFVVCEREPGGYWGGGGRGDFPEGLVVRSPDLSPPAWMRWRGGEIWKRWRLWKAIRELHRKQPFDLVECMDNWGCLQMSLPDGVPDVVRLHGATFFFDERLGSKTSDPFTHRLERRAILRATHRVAVSKYIAQDEMSLVGGTEEGIPVIYNAVDTAWLSPDSTVAEEEGLIVFANTIHPRKGVFELCRAINRVLIEVPGSRLVIIGKEFAKTGGGRTYKEELLELIRPELRGRVEFTGRLKERGEVYAWLKRASVCCYPSHLEAFGIAPLEAMALGKAVMYSKTGPGPEVIEDGVSGVLCDPHDPEDIATRLLSMLSRKEWRRQLGSAARDRAVRLFDKQPWVRANESFYRSISGKQADELPRL